MLANTDWDLQQKLLKHFLLKGFEVILISAFSWFVKKNVLLQTRLTP